MKQFFATRERTEKQNAVLQWASPGGLVESPPSRLVLDYYCIEDGILHLRQISEMRG